MVAFNNCACAFQKLTLSPRLRTTVQVILIPILYALACMMFFQARLLQKKKRIGHNLVHTCKIFVASSLCTLKSKLKTKGYEEQRKNSKNNIRVALCEKTVRKKKHLTLQKWPFRKGYSKAKWSILGLSFKVSETYRNYPLISLELFYTQQLNVQGYCVLVIACSIAENYQAFF